MLHDVQRPFLMFLNRIISLKFVAYTMTGFDTLDLWGPITHSRSRVIISYGNDVSVEILVEDAYNAW